MPEKTIKALERVANVLLAFGEGMAFKAEQQKKARADAARDTA